MALKVLMCGGRSRLSDAAWSIARGFERLGHEVRHVGTRKAGTKYDPIDDAEAILGTIVKEWQPHILLWIMCKFDCPPGLVAALRRLRPEMKTVFHSFDDPQQIDVTGTPWVEGFEYAVTCCEGSIPFYQERGLDAICLYPPADRDLHGRAQPKEEELCDFAFAATNVYSRKLFPHVIAERTEVVRVAAKAGNLHLYGPWDGTRSTWGGQFGAPELKGAYKGRRTWEEMAIIYASSKITLNSHNRPDGYKYLNERTIHAIAAGSFMLTDHVAGLEEVLKPGIHLDTWSSLEELEEKLTWWFQRPMAREQVVRAGKAFVLHHHDNVAHNRKLLAFLKLLY